MRSKMPGSLAIGLMLGTTLASAGTISYICDPTIDTLGPANTCAVLNSTVAGLYNNTFTNANASIYISYGMTDLGESTAFTNFVSYNEYRSALIAESGAGAVRAGAVNSLPSIEPALYKGADVDVLAALGSALGFTGMTGIEADATTACILGTTGCYDAVITIEIPAILASNGQGFYYRTGVQSVNDFDFYTIVQHETDEGLGTFSCVDTDGSITDYCGTTTPAAIDLFRYNGNGNRVLVSSTPGAYFSYDGGSTNGADGAAFNTLPNGDDYADFTTNCAHVQDATACLGGSFDITNDGNAEINMLDAVGYDIAGTTTTPEPATLALLGAGVALIGFFRRRPRR